MPFIRGKDIKAFITTELAGARVMLTGSSPDSTSLSCGMSMTPKGVGALGSVTSSTNTTDRFVFLEAIDEKKGWVDDEGNFFGTQKDYMIPMKKKWELTLTIKGEDSALSLLASGARYGVTGSASGQLHTGLTEILGSTGYRLYVHNGLRWDVYYHGIIPADGYGVRYDPNKAMIQTIKFVGNEWDTNLADSQISAAKAQE